MSGPPYFGAPFGSLSGPEPVRVTQCHSSSGLTARPALLVHLYEAERKALGEKLHDGRGKPKKEKIVRPARAGRGFQADVPTTPPCRAFMAVYSSYAVYVAASQPIYTYLRETNTACCAYFGSNSLKWGHQIEIEHIIVHRRNGRPTVYFSPYRRYKIGLGLPTSSGRHHGEGGGGIKRLERCQERTPHYFHRKISSALQVH